LAFFICLRTLLFFLFFLPAGARRVDGVAGLIYALLLAHGGAGGGAVGTPRLLYDESDWQWLPLARGQR
jgi:hypothetical protein